MARPETTTVPRRLIDLLSGRYAFVSVLGRGGAGIVYEVRNIRLGRLEALKVLTNSLSDDTTRRFVQEARVCASLDHAGIVRVYDFGHLEGIHWYSMQLINGPSLAAIIDSGRQLRVDDFAKLSIPLMDALDYSHRNGVVHRDIKPANIMLLGSGAPCLTDFGIAKSADSLDFTQTSNVLGTPAYMSPEQADGSLVDGRTDQYSLAITFYRAITGRLPFSSVGPVETLVQRLKEDPEPIDWHCPDFPVPLKHVLMKALSRDREDRYPTIGSMKKSMLTACESCHVAWHEPFSLKGLEHLTAANRKPIEQGGQGGQGEQGGHGDMATQAAMTTAMRSLRTRWWDADRPHSVVTLVAVALVVAMALFIALWSRGPLAHPPPPGPPPGAQHERPPGAQPERSPGAQPEQSTGAQPAPWAQPGGLRPVSGRTADGKGPEAAPAPAPAKPAAPAPAPQAPQAKSGPQAGAKVRREPALLSAGLLLPPGVRQGLAEIGVVALRVGVSVSRHGRATDHKVLNQLRRPLTGEEERAIHEGVRLLEFEPATEDGEPVAGKMSFYVPLV